MRGCARSSRGASSALLREHVAWNDQQWPRRAPQHTFADRTLPDTLPSTPTVGAKNDQISLPRVGVQQDGASGVPLLLCGPHRDAFTLGALPQGRQQCEAFALVHREWIVLGHDVKDVEPAFAREQSRCGGGRRADPAHHGAAGRRSRPQLRRCPADDGSRCQTARTQFRLEYRRAGRRSPRLPSREHPIRRFGQHSVLGFTRRVDGGDRDGPQRQHPRGGHRVSVGAGADATFVSNSRQAPTLESKARATRLALSARLARTLRST